MDDAWLVADRARREVQHILLLCFDGLSSQFGHRRVEALRRLLSFLGTLASGENVHQKVYFLSLQTAENEFNVLFKILSALTSADHIPAEFISAEEYIRTFQVAEGLCLIHADAARQLCNLGALELIIAVTEQCATQPQSHSREVFANALDLLSCILLQSPTYLQSFVDLEGVNVLVGFVHRKGMARPLRAKATEVLYQICSDSRPVLSSQGCEKCKTLMGSESFKTMMDLLSRPTGLEGSIEQFLRTVD